MNIMFDLKTTNHNMKMVLRESMLIGALKRGLQKDLVIILKGWGGYYSQGVGASNYAYKLYQAGNRALAMVYAQKALVAWAQCLSYDNNYYNAYVHYGLTLGILGDKTEMLRALQRGAELIHQDLTYPEFKKVIELIDKLPR